MHNLLDNITTLIDLDTRLKRKIENNSIWEGALYQGNKQKFIQNELFSFVHVTCVAADAFELFCKAYLANNERFLCHSKLSF